MNFHRSLAAGAAALAALALSGTVASAQNWTGLYLGANLGGSWANNSASYSQAGGNGAFSTSNRNSSAIGGGQAGYNWQSGQLVFGLETDISFRNNTANGTFFPFPANTVDAVSLSQSERWLGTLRPRVGFASNAWLFYVTGGLAYGNIQHSYFENRTTVAGQNRFISDSTTKSGWTLGGGVEWALSRNWTIGAEYLRVDLGSSSLSLPAQTVGGLPFPASSANFSDRSDIVRAKVNYRF